MVLAASTPVNIAREEVVEDGENLRSNLAPVLYIYYPMNFRKKSVFALLDSYCEINAIYPTFTKKLDLLIRSTDNGGQKINGIILDTYRMILLTISMTDKANQGRFFEETFLMANVSSEVIFGMFFLIFSSANIDFLDQKLCWRTYTTKETSDMSN